MPRPRASSLTIYISAAHKWRAPRPSTPRRQTFPGGKKLSSTSNANIGMVLNVDIPPVPTLSYFEPDTPIEPIISPALLSPTFPGSSPVSPEDTLLPNFTPASPSLYSPTSPNLYSYTYQYPSSLLSPQVQALPLSPVHRFSCIPSCEPSPMSPRFLFPRTPPLPPQHAVRSRLMSQTLLQYGGSTSPTNYCFGVGMGGRRHSTPYHSSPLVLCGHTSNSVDRTTRKPEHGRVLGWPSVDSPVRLYFKKMEVDKERKKALRQRRFKVVKRGEGMSVGAGVGVTVAVA
jgi:hypothetical protein